MKGGQSVSTDQLARDVLESLLEGCQVVGFDYAYLYVNPAVVRQSHKAHAELVGRTMMECFPGIEETPMFAELGRCMTERVHGALENEFTFPDGTTGWFELRFVPVPEGVCVLSLDITERKRSEAELERTHAQLLHAQKMEAVGRLAAGVAHDFNNLLSIILSYAELGVGDLKADDPLFLTLDEIRKAGIRAAGLTRELLKISRQQPVEKRVIDLNQIVGGMKDMLVRLLGADIELAVLPSQSLGKVESDAGALEQVILNLVVNARDAMPKGGKLTLETANVELDGAYARSHLGVEPGPYVMLAVSDTGIGMDKETQVRIFEPYFTTKEKGKGTGLGLSTVFGIVKQNAGHVWVYSEPGAGATFKVYLPRSDAKETAVFAEVTEPESSRGHETILLVEDDDQVRTVARTILRRSGYRVLEASNGGEALLTCEQHPATIHLLLTDVVLPKMSGRLLADRLAALRPAMKVLFMSGYADEAVLQHGILESEVAYLQKPLTPEALTRRVREVLGPARGADRNGGTGGEGASFEI